MHDAATHSFLSQIPLIISPFLKLPQPVALPLNYATLPRGLPPSSTARFNEVKAVLASVDEQQRRATEQQDKAKDKVSQWESDVLLQETMQQRRIAPGYLDSDVHMLHPTQLGSQDAVTTMGSYATPQDISLRVPSDQQISAAPATTSLPPYSSPGHDASSHATFGYGQQPPASMHPYTSSMASSAASSTPSLNGYSATSTPQHASVLNSLPSLPSQTTPYHNDYSTYQGQHTPTYEAPSYQRQPSISSQRSSPIAQPSPSVPRQAPVALPDRATSPSPAGPPLPPHPPAEFVNRPLRISSMRKPLVSEFPWSSTASFAARTFSGTASGISSSADSKYSIRPSSSTRTDTSSLYEGASFRRSSLPRLDSYRSRDTGYNSLDAKLSEYLGSSNANTNGYRSTSYNTLQRIDYSLPREQASDDTLGDLNLLSSTVHESVGLIDLEDEDLAPAQTPAPAAPSLAAPITNSFSVPGTMTPSSSALASNFPDYLSDDHVTSPPIESVLAARSQDDMYASASRFKSSANYLDKDLNNSDISHADDLYGHPTIKSVTADSDSDDDFSALTERKATTSHLALATDIETPVDESELDFNAVSVMEEEAGAERAEGMENAEEEPDQDAKIEEMLRQLQEEIDMEEKAAARAKREARRRALEEAEAAVPAENVQATHAVEAPMERASDEIPAEGTGQESPPSEVVCWTEKTLQRDEQTSRPTDEDVAEDVTAYESSATTPASEADVECVLERSVNSLDAENSLSSPYNKPDLDPLSPSSTDSTSALGPEMSTFKIQPDESEPAPENINGDVEFSALQKPATTELLVVREDAVEEKEKEEPLDLQETNKVEANLVLDPTAFTSTTSTNTTSAEDDGSLAIPASTTVTNDAAFDEVVVSECRDKLSDVVLEKHTGQRNEEYRDTEERGEEKITLS
ncbi:uncharacterized protein V1513DRAFT_435237 [Lipomyces chichibuensis]|uniref:uncharacterized protein n=1 Tax=Lipomyces chichibuensis TaxID=1546026 RepID=UPI00334322BE